MEETSCWVFWRINLTKYSRRTDWSNWKGKIKGRRSVTVDPDLNLNHLIWIICLASNIMLNILHCSDISRRFKTQKYYLLDKRDCCWLSPFLANNWPVNEHEVFKQTFKHRFISAIFGRYLTTGAKTLSATHWKPFFHRWLFIGRMVNKQDKRRQNQARRTSN